MTKANNDSDDLEALFDSIVAGSNESAAPAPVAAKPVASAAPVSNTDVIK